MYGALGHTVFITGRKDPHTPDLRFLYLPIDHDADDWIKRINSVLAEVEKINTLIYVAGYYQEGPIDRLSDQQILAMIHVGLTAPALLVQRLKNNPGKPLKIMLITSSSQYTPRQLEPVYTAVKSGLGMLGASLSLDPAIGKVLVVAPSGMKTPFWDKTKDTTGFLDPHWTAGKIIELSGGPFKYRFAKILRSPERVEIVETRQQ